MKGLQRSEGAQGLGNTLQHALRDRDQIEQLAVPEMIAEVGIGHLQDLGKSTTPQRLPQHGQDIFEVGQG